MKLEQIYKTPTNPEFGYHLFESISCIVSVMGRRDPASMDIIESLVLPIFMKIVMEAGSDVFSPFVFQLLSYFLETRNSLPEKYKPLIKELVTPIYWEQSGNLPAVTRLIRAYIQTGTDHILSNNLLIPILGVFQKLVASRVNDHLGFLIIQSIVQHFPLNTFSFALPEIFKLTFTRIQSAKTPQLVRSFIIFFSHLIVFHGPGLFIDTLRSLQPNLLQMVIQSLWLTYVDSVKDKIDRKVCAVAMTKLIAESGDLNELRAILVQKIQNLIVGLPTTITTNEEFVPDGEEEKDYTSGYTLLSHVMRITIDPCKEINPAALLQTVPIN